jgi:hypothetical protein
MAEFGIVLKAGDRDANYREGWIVTVLDMRATSWGNGGGYSLEEIISDWMRKTFAIVRCSAAALPLIIAAMQEGQPGLPTQCLKLETIAGLAGDANLLQRWRAKGEIVPIVDVLTLLPRDFTDTAEVMARALLADLNAVSAGLYTLGPAKNYVNIDAFEADWAATVTGALTGRMEANTTETSGFSWGEPDLDGNRVRITSDTDHSGDLSAGRKATVTNNGYSIRWRPTSSSAGGVMQVDTVVFVSGGGGQAAMGQFDVNSDVHLDVLHNLYDLNNTCDRAIDVNAVAGGATGNAFDIFGNCVLDPSSACIRVQDAKSTSVVEQNTGLELAVIGADGIDCDDQDFICRNNACRGFGANGGDDFNKNTFATGRNNASGDPTAGNGVWNVGSGNYTGLAAGDFVGGANDPWKIDNTSALYQLGTNPSAATAYVNGEPITVGDVDTGAWGVTRAPAPSGENAPLFGADL